MAGATSTIPEWLKASQTSPHFISVLRSLAERERTRKQSRQHTSRSNRASHTVNVATSKPIHANHYSVSVGSSTDNDDSNRYVDIVPYDRTRAVVSLTGVDRAANVGQNGRYLNANWVRECAGRKWWIATQAPLPHTAHAFLSVLLKPIHSPIPATSYFTRVRTVVQLTQKFERGMQKAHVYFPSEEGQSWRIPPEEGCNDPTLKVTLLLTRHIEDARCLQSRVSIEPLGASQTGPVVFNHLLYGSWPDHGVPSSEDRASLLRFAHLVDEVNRDLSSQPQPQSANLDPDPPIMVNCSAGVGRTGAFIALSSLLRAYGFLPPALTPPGESPLSPSPLGPLPQDLQDDLVAQEIDQLREQRPSMVQKDEQVIFLYDMLITAFTGTGDEHS